MFQTRKSDSQQESLRGGHTPVADTIRKAFPPSCATLSRLQHPVTKLLMHAIYVYETCLSDYLTGRFIYLRLAIMARLEWRVYGVFAMVSRELHAA